MKERIIEFLRAENKSSAQFAEEIGVQPSGISHILSGRNNPSLDFVLKMLERYKYLSSDWLLFGKGSMYKESGGMKNLFEQTLFDQQPAPDRKKDEKSLSQVKNEASQDQIIEAQKELMTEKRSLNRFVEKIVWFFSDGSFEEYNPGK